MAEIRMIFCDIDGTLIDSGNQLRPGTRDVIRRLAARGIPLVLASGRSPRLMAPIAEELGIRAPIISQSGAIVLDENGMPLRSVGIPSQTAVEIRGRVLRNWPGTHCNLNIGPRDLAHDPARPWLTRDNRVKIGVDGEIPVLAPDEQINRVVCIADSPALTDALEHDLRENYPDMLLQKSWPTYLEIQHAEATKGYAARFLCAYLGIAPVHTLSFGDYYNDIDLFRATGVSYAMANAPKAVRQAATHVTGSNDEDGVAQVLERLLHGAFDEAAYSATFKIGCTFCSNFFPPLTATDKDTPK